MKHVKGKASSSNVVNYDYTNHITDIDSLVDCIEPTNNHVNIIIVQGANPPSTQNRLKITIQGGPIPPQPASRPNPTKIVIQGAAPSTFHSQNDYSVTTYHERVTIQGVPPPPNPPPMSSTRRYGLLDHLGKIPAQVSILELLKTSPIHKDILEETLLESHVPDNINDAQFQALIRNLATQQHLVFSSNDTPTNDYHNKPFHIEALIQKHEVKCILVDSGSGLNLYTYKFIK